VKGLMDDNGRFLSPEEILAMSKTEDGKELLKKYILRARTALAVHEMLTYFDELGVLSRALTAEEQQNMCSLYWNVFFNYDQAIVHQFVNDIYEWAKREGSLEYGDDIPEC